ncbi:hypothetical protein [Promicromonospora soli]
MARRHDVESVDVHLTEYEQLLEESRLHQTIASAIVSLEIGALGVGLPLSVNSSYALLGLAVVSSLLWFRYMDHMVGIFHLAEYVATHLRPKLEALVHERVLGWEAYLRRRRATATFLRFRRRPSAIPGLSYTAILFGGAPVVLMAVFLLTVDLEGEGYVLPISGAATAAIIWASSLVRYVRDLALISAIDATLLDPT